MVRYEVLTCQRGRWTADGILDSRSAAVEHAQALADRNYRVAAVRVMALEEDADGFKEQIVYNRKIARASAVKGGPAHVIGKPMVSPKARSGVGARILVLLLFIACAALMGYGLMKPKQPWVFDSPAAQKPHLLRNSFTGDFT